MVKIPATKEGIPAIRKAIAAGVNVNVTLIFSLARYVQVMDAYLSGLEDRSSSGYPIENIASVASFFVSRVDSKIDPKLPVDSKLKGKAAIANAKLAYDLFQQTFAGRRWENLKVKGARVQRPLWASTSTKNPSYPDTLYVDELIGPESVNTVPPSTLDAFKAHGTASMSLLRGVDEAKRVMEQLNGLGIEVETITQELEREGVIAFADAFTDLLSTIDERKKIAASSLGIVAASTAKQLARLEMESFPTRLWKHDPTLWTKNKTVTHEIKNRLGWMSSVPAARNKVKEFTSFASEIHSEKIDRVLVLGMGGSSLTAEVFSSLLANSKIEAPLSLAILDSTDPSQVAEMADQYPPEKSLYIVASKSGETIETMMAFKYFWKLSKKDSSRFVAITDPGTSLEKLAKKNKFRRIFSSPETVGGRFSSLTDFGLVPAALLGMDLQLLLGRASWMQNQSDAYVPAARNPGVALGAVLAEAVKLGKDKLTILCDPKLSAFATWIEQIVAESSGKKGKGILPVIFEQFDDESSYKDDRVFVYLNQSGELVNRVQKIRELNHPVVEIPFHNVYDVGAEILRWEIAVSTACSILEINPFDQPNVEAAKKITKSRLENYKRKGKLREQKPAWKKDGVQVFSKNKIIGASLGNVLEGYLKKAKPNGYIAINAYLPRNREMIDVLQKMRIAIRRRTGNVVTAGFGPRFQHSTGQFHKGGTNNGMILQVTVNSQKEIAIPSERVSFGTLIRAQAIGEFEALVDAGRKVLRIHLSSVEDLPFLVESLESLT